METAKITEIFSSVQGEGIFVGQPQIFIRFSRCNLNCDFCDTVKSGGKNYDLYDLLDFIGGMSAVKTIDTISLTGGEPLLHVDFLTRVLPHLKKRNFKIYLETNGTLPAALEKVVGLVDVVAMDMKLPSSNRGRNFWTRHRDFLNIARKKTVFVKVVATAKTSLDEIRKVIAIIDDIDADIPLVIQPVTPANRVRKKVQPDKLFEFQRLAKMVLNDVRIIPQMHKLIGVK